MSIWVEHVSVPDAGSVTRGAAGGLAAPTPVRRVRQEVRDALAVACFQAGASVTVALTLVLMVRLVGQQA